MRSPVCSPGCAEARLPPQWSIVVFGEPGSEPILGVVSLEEFRLAADSVPGRLKAAVGGR